MVMGDLNEYIYRQQVKYFFSDLCLRDLILDKYGTEGPATTISKKENQAIDRI